MEELITQLEIKLKKNQEAQAEYQVLVTLLQSSQRAGARFLECVQKYREKQENLKSYARDFESILEEKRTLLGEEMYDGFYQEGEALNQYAKEETNPFFSVNQMAQWAERNLYVLRETERALSTVRPEDGNKALEGLAECRRIFREYTLEEMVVDYSEIQFVRENGIMSFLKGLYKRIGSSVFEVITAEVEEISQKSVDIDGLALEYITAQERARAKEGTSLTERALFTQYLLTNFSCFQDTGIEGRRPYGEEYLDYGLEFILCGAQEDRENLKNTLMSMVKFREGINLMHLFTDYEKKQEAYAFAATLLGFTGSQGIIKSGQYLLMAAWAYGESIMDVKQLVAGGKLDWYKTAQTWQLSLEQLLAFQYESDAEKSKGTLAYKDMLGIMLFLQDDGFKYYNTMSAMEMRMIQMGYATFRMKNFIYRIRGTASFHIYDSFYEKEFDYRY